MPQRRRTRTSVPAELVPGARHVVAPAGIVSTGWPSVRDTSANFGVLYDPWQSAAGRLILAKRKDGRYAASVGGVVISIARQVGKTYMIGGITFALCLLFPGLTVLWTAHRARTAAETFAAMQAFAERPLVRPHVENIVRGAGDEAVVFRNGSRILFGARERGFGRGFADVDVIVFDEAQILTENAVDDMVPTMNAAANPLPIFVGTPPKPKDPSEVFTRKRAEALAGEDRDTLLIEFGADRGADPNDRKQWRKANPSYPKRTPAASILRMKKNLTAESFLREGLGIWDLDATPQLINAGNWRRGLSTDSELVGVPVFALEVTEDRSWSTFAVAGTSSLGALHGEIVSVLAGTAGTVAEAKRLCERHGAKELVVAKGSAAAALVKALVKVGLTVHELSVDEQARACGQLVDVVNDGTLRHLPHPALEVAVANVAKKAHGVSGFVWEQKKATVDVTSLAALTWALAKTGVRHRAYSSPAATGGSSEMFRPSERLRI